MRVWPVGQVPVEVLCGTNNKLFDFFNAYGFTLLHTSGSEKISNGVYAKTAEKPTISEVTIGFYDSSWV